MRYSTLERLSFLLKQVVHVKSFVFRKFVHVSTAFSFATQERVGKEIFEQFYPCPVSPDVMISLAEELDESKLNNLTNKYVNINPRVSFITY